MQQTPDSSDKVEKNDIEEEKGYIGQDTVQIGKNIVTIAE